MPAVSIIIPTFSRCALLQRALASVASQSFSDYEVIVVDDGSTDQTVEIVGRIADHRVKLIRHEMNRGAAAARNTGIRAAKGDWIAFLDSDDTWRPEKLARQLERMRSTAPNVLACSSGYYLYKDHRTLIVSLDMPPGAFSRDIMFGCTISPGTTLLVARRVFDEIGLFDETFQRLEDWDWLLRYSEHYDMAFVPDQLADIYYQEMSQANYRSERAELVLNAIKYFGDKHLGRMNAARRKSQLQGTLYVEMAACMYRSGRPLSAIGYVILALAAYPYRNMAFIGSLWRAFGTLLRR